VAFIVDVFSQRILAWHASTSKATDLVLTPLRMAIWQRHPDGHHLDQLVHHSDSKTGECQVFPGFVTLTTIGPGGYRGVGGVLAAS